MIRFFFNYENQVVQLPINPGSLAVNTSSDTKSMEIVELGEITILKGLKLKEFKFSSFFPNFDKYPFILTKGEFKEPQFYIDFFNKVMSDKKPCRLVISDTDINILVSIVSFNTSIVAGDDDTTFDISLKEFREHRIKILQVQEEIKTAQTTEQTTTTKVTSSVANSESNRPIENAVPKTYTVKSGDSLWAIAKSQLGNGNRYNEIYNLNKDKIKNPNLIYAGQVLTMPV